MLLSLILFGSRARGDHRLTSDVDLLGVIDGGLIREEKTNRGTSLYRYPLDYLRNKSEGGDLFMLHLVREGKILHDTGNLFGDICDRFQFQSSYEEAIRTASLVCWFLSERPHLLQKRKVRKRLIWSLRTVVIARAAEKHEAVFSSSDVANYIGEPDLKSLIDRRFTVEPEALINAAIMVVSKYGFDRTALEWPSSKVEQSRSLLAEGGICASTVHMNSRRLTPRPEPQTDELYI